MNHQEERDDLADDDDDDYAPNEHHFVAGSCLIEVKRVVHTRCRTGASNAERQGVQEKE